MGIKINPFTGQFDLVGGTPASLQGQVDDLIELSGVPANSTDLGAFTGDIIPDDVTIKEALQSLETFIESLPSPFFYAGTYNATINTPDLDLVGARVSGAVYYVNVAGTHDFGAFGGIIPLDISDKIVFNGITGVWDKWDNTDSVASVFGRIGAVIAVAGDYTANQIDYDNTSSGLAATNVQDAIDEVYSELPALGTPNTFTGYDSSGELYSIPGWQITEYAGGVDAFTNTDGSTQSNVEKINFATTLGDGVSGHIDNFSALTSYTNTNANFDIDSFIGFNNNVQIQNGATVDSIIMNNVTLDGDTAANVIGTNVYLSDDKGDVTLNQSTHNSGVVGSVNGYRLDLNGMYDNVSGFVAVTQGTVNGQVEVISSSNTATVTGNYIGMNDYQQGIISGSYNGISIGQAATATSNGANMVNVNNQADVDDYFNGILVINSGDITGTGNYTGLSSDNQGAAVNYSGLTINNSGVITDNVNPVQVYDNSASPDANFTGIQGSFSGTYDTVQGISIDVSAATSISNDGRKIAANFNGGSIQGFTPFTTISDNPSVVDSGNGIITQFTVVDGSPIENTSVLANNLAGLATFNDDFTSDPFFELGYAMVGFVGQLSVADTKTVDTVSMALGGASVPVESTGGTIQEAIMFNAKGIFSAGGTLNIDTIYGLKVDSNLSAMSPTQAYGIYVEDANADNYFEGDITRINGLDTSFPAVQGDAGDVLTNDGSGNLTWEPVPSVGEPGDIPSTAFAGDEGEVTPVNVTGFDFDNGVVRSFEANVTVIIDATSDLYETFTLNGIQKTSSWDMSVTSTGDDSGVTFSIDSSGQIQYTSDTYTGFTSLTIKFRAWAIGV